MPRPQLSRRLLSAAIVAMSAAVPVLAQDAAPAASAPAAGTLTPTTAAQLIERSKSSGAAVTVVNLWATWCAPCRAEFPDLLRFYRTYKDRGVTLELLSTDFSSETEAAREFLAEQGVDFPTWLKSQPDEEMINAFDPAWSGALPATFVYDRDGKRRHSFLGPVTYESLEREVVPLLQP